jgi:hypothetical protein
MKTLPIYCIVIGLFVIKAGYSQNENSFSAFTNRSFYKPFVSEISSTLNNIMVGSVENTLPNGEKRMNTFSEEHLGVDIPILYAEQRKFKWAMSAPVSFRMGLGTF